MSLTLIDTPLDITTSDTAVATVDITSGIDSTYDSYEFHCVNMHPASSGNFSFQVNNSGQSGFNETMTSTSWQTFRNQAAGWNALTGETGFGYNTAIEQGNEAAYQTLTVGTGASSYTSCSGVLKLHSPSSTTYQKSFSAEFNSYYVSGYTYQTLIAGYFDNRFTGVTQISFKFSSGNIDAGTIKMFGVK